MMGTVCELDRCTGCSLCVGKCPKNAIHIEDSIKAYNARIDERLCVNCEICREICPSNHPIERRAPVLWRQGWALDENIRIEGSSGGIATALAKAFVENGGIVCSCVFNKGDFVFDFASSVDEAKRFSGSKYVKSDPTGIYPKIGSLLQDGKKVLFIGLPCQAAAVQRYTRNHASLYVVDLICHGTPSPKILRGFLAEKGRDIETMHDIKFRRKARFYLSDGYRGIRTPSVFDQYTYAFLNALCYTKACYACQYAETSRVSDITLGDSWGSKLPVEEQRKGISLILCQTEKGRELLDMADLQLEDVDVEVAVANNKQLQSPSSRPDVYDRFYAEFLRTNDFSRAVNKCYPVVFFKQAVKALLIRCGIIWGKNG